MSCNCIDILNERFAPENFFIPRIQWTNMSTFGDKKQSHKNTVIIQVSKLKTSRTKLKKIVPTFCPFCGKKYEYEEEASKC